MSTDTRARAAAPASIPAPVLEVELQGTIGDLSLDLTFEAGPGPTVIVGPNGAGKTSALLMVLGALAPRAGRVVLEGVVLFDARRGVEIPVERRQIGFLPQRLGLFPHLDALGNVAFGIAGGTRAARDREARGLLREMGVESVATRRAHELSGGEAQRVALARALARRPRALLLDEPLAAQDASLRRELRRFLAQQLQALHIPSIIVTHDRADAEALGGAIIVLERGSVVQRGRMDDLARRPASAFVSQFVGQPPPPP